MEDKEVERVEDRRPQPIKSPFEVFRGSPREGRGQFNFRTRNLRKKLEDGGGRVWVFVCACVCGEGGGRSRPKFFQ